LSAQGDWAALEKTAFDFSDKQSEAFGAAAEILTEQRILDSDEQGKWAIDDARRFAAIGRAANPDSARLDELAKLAERRARDIDAGEPVETLNWDGLSNVELNRLSQGLQRGEKCALAKIAARRSVPRARLRTGEKSTDYAGALAQHAGTLRALGSHREAEALYREALEIDRATLGEAHPEYAKDLGNLGWLLEQALAIFRAALPAEHPHIAETERRLADLPGDAG